MGQENTSRANKPHRGQAQEGAFPNQSGAQSRLQRRKCSPNRFKSRHLYSKTNTTVCTIRRLAHGRNVRGAQTSEKRYGQGFGFSGRQWYGNLPKCLSSGVDGSNKQVVSWGEKSCYR